MPNRRARLLIYTLLLLILPAVVTAGPAGAPQQFVTVSLHDIADDPAQLDDAGVSSDRLVTFFEWLAGNGWNPVSLDDIERARRGEKPLPEKAILITVDDGYRSLYTRIYPLALVYRIPLLAAVVGSWLDAPAGSQVPYGGRTLPRAHFITWAQAREMQDSGLVEFASHSYNLHREVLGNPQGNRLPAAVTRRYTPGRGYEREADYRARLRADLRRSRQQLQRHLGKAPRAIVWPFGRYNQITREVAAELGYRYDVTLDPEPSHLPTPDAPTPYSISRYLPTDNPKLGVWVQAMQFHDPWPNARRLVPVDPADFDSASAAETNRRLGQALEALLAMGATHVVIDAALPDVDGGLAATWFPTSQLPMRRDLLSRLAAQMRARAGVQIILRLPHRRALQTLGSEQRVLALFRDLARRVPFEGLLLEDVPALDARAASASQLPWQVREIRQHRDVSRWPPADALAIKAFRIAEQARPDLQLFWLSTADHSLLRASPLADLTLVPAALTAPLPFPAGVARYPTNSGRLSRRVGIIWWSPAPPDARALKAAARTFQRRGGTAYGWYPQDLLRDRPAAKQIAPAVSSRTFPARGALKQ
ncbi:poly-beta-1,6-N-acetyl-D-glucosamine N-deacetylase PgaB [Microbulbifer sp. SAOS-129_SWC]|uniref:poly-beta-1,6-N-acetyl-D-glucosamine N-deacetylase PgaB n=1 Tax=Microbulbifer sp. SAOS-129_SWC TaxID=3145235 RepID=UPI003217CF7D